MNQKNADFLNGKPPAAEPPKKYSDNASYDDYDSPKNQLRPRKPDPTATEHAD